MSAEVAASSMAVTTVSTAVVELDDRRSEDGAAVSSNNGGGGGLRSAMADAERRRAGRRELSGDLMQDRAKLVACGVILLLHGATLVALDVIMIRRRCSGLLGGAFAVLAASMSALLSGLLLALQRAFSRRGVAAVACLWASNLAADACWLGLTLGRLSSDCLGTAMIGATAVGLVSCPASLVAFVILFGWFGPKAG